MVLAIRPLTEASSDQRPRVGFALGDAGLIVYHGKKRVRHTYSIDVMNLSMVRHIVTDKVLMGRDILSLVYLNYLYTLRLVNTRSIRRMTSVDRDVVTQMKENVFKSLDLVRYKIATLRCIKLGLTPDDANAIGKQFQACGLQHIDGLLFHLLYFNTDLIDFMKQMTLIKDAHFSLDVDTIPDEIDDYVLSEFDKACNYHAYGIRFVATANRMELQDLRNDLKERAIQAYYWVRPFFSKEHAINYGKAATYGFSHNLRDHYQHPDRARAINTGEGYDNAHHALDDNMSTYDHHTDEEDNIIAMIDEKACYR